MHNLNIACVAKAGPSQRRVTCSTKCTDLAVPVVLLENGCGPWNTFESCFFHGHLELLEHVIGEYAADNHVVLARVFDKLLRQCVRPECS